MLDARSIPGGGAATEELLRPGLPDRLLLDRPHADPSQPAADRGRARPDLRLRPRVLRARPGGARRLPRRRAADDVAGHRPDLRGDRALLASRTPRPTGGWSPSTTRSRGSTRARARRRRASAPRSSELLLEHPRGRIWLRRNAMSAWDVIRREFESRHVQAFMVWQAFQTLVPIDAAGSGSLAYSIIFGRQRRSWSIPRGGSGSLTQALVGFLEDHGATDPVRPPRVEARARGRALHRRRDGRRRALHGAHGRALDDPRQAARRDGAGRGLGRGVRLRRRDLRRRHVRAWPPTSPPRRRRCSRRRTGRAARSRPAPSAGPSRCSSSAGRVRDRRPYDDGVPWLLVATPTLVDPDRAPAGHHTVKLLSPQTMGPPRRARRAGRSTSTTIARRQLEHVRRYVPGLAEENIVAAYVKSPEDIERGEPAHDPRRLPRRRPQLRLQRQPAPGAGLGGAPHADPGALPDRRDHAASAARSPASRAATPRS